MRGERFESRPVDDRDPLVAMPAWRQKPRARSVRDRSGSIVTIVAPAGWARAIQSVE